MYVVSIGDSKEWVNVEDENHQVTGRRQIIFGTDFCNEGGNLEIGDLFCTSSSPGYFMKQSDDIVRSSTAGKCLEKIEFGETGQKQDVYCIMMCG